MYIFISIDNEESIKRMVNDIKTLSRKIKRGKIASYGRIPYITIVR